MRSKALLIVHRSDEKDDRASAFLAARGLELVWSCPAEGDSIPELDDSTRALIVYGGRSGVPDTASYPFLSLEMRVLGKALERDIPVLGLCLGAQLLARELGAWVGPHPDGVHEYGYYPLRPTLDGFALIPDGLMVLQSHYHQFDLPAGARNLASSELYPHQAFRYGEKAFGLQFHPEATRQMLKAWIGRRGERNRAPGAHPPARQLADNFMYDAALAGWFRTFLEEWAAPAFFPWRGAGLPANVKSGANSRNC